MKLAQANCRHAPDKPTPIAAHIPCAAGECGGMPSEAYCRRKCKIRVPAKPEDSAIVWITESVRFDGSAIWKAMHTRHRAYKGDAAAERAALVADLAALPCGSCRVDATADINKNPPPLGEGSDALFGWGFDFHNRVNAKVGHPQFSRERADSLYPAETSA